jgi:tRNA-specific 2-thiouridylase
MWPQSWPTAIPKIRVAMSGGLDSSVAAALLKRAGFNVEGMFLKLYDSPRFKQGERRAKRIAGILKIPLKVLDLRKEFKKEVISYFLQSYQAGRTPNPCVICNKKIKFNFAGWLATGHYVRKVDSKLLRARDKGKDQSYFLWQLNQKQLKHLLFPLGYLTKKEVKILAKKFSLPVFAAPASQEVCFVQKTINDFLVKYIKAKPGRIVDTAGKTIGQHQGLAFYTIGQRKGLGLAGGPYWVLGKDLKRNFLLVTKNEKDLLKKELTFKNVNWLSGKAPKLPLKVKAKIRYRHQLSSATISKNYKLTFKRAQRAVTPDQSVVFYKGEELLGGGIIC